jgi:hypothetical protein
MRWIINTLRRKERRERRSESRSAKGRPVMADEEQSTEGNAYPFATERRPSPDGLGGPQQPQALPLQRTQPQQQPYGVFGSQASEGPAQSSAGIGRGVSGRSEDPFWSLFEPQVDGTFIGEKNKTLLRKRKADAQESPRKGSIQSTQSAGPRATYPVPPPPPPPPPPQQHEQNEQRQQQQQQQQPLRRSFMQRFGAIMPAVAQATVNPQSSAAKAPPRAPFATHRNPPSSGKAAAATLGADISEELVPAPDRLDAEEKRGESEEARRNIDTLI